MSGHEQLVALRTPNTQKKANILPPVERTWKFDDLLRDDAVRERWEKVQRFFYLRESTYDLTNVCNLDCDGCFYFQGDKQFTKNTSDPEAWRALMREEKKRGINFVVLAGAEASLVPEIIEACYSEVQLGVVATNGIKKIPEELAYRIHVSVWGNDESSAKTRLGKGLLPKQIKNYAGDSRAVFIYTFTRHNIAEAPAVIEELAKNDCRSTFSMFSAPVGYTGTLRHDAESLAAVRATTLDLLERFPKHVLFSHYNAVAHTHEKSMYELFSCPYPRVNKQANLGIGKTFRGYRTDLSWNMDASCCVPDIDCADCRHHASGTAIVASKLFRHATDPDTFAAWLDYVDVYLAHFVHGYEKSANLCRKPVAPPGFKLMEG
jgi:MoaA/NifB/PqqE/SkfB family radical SAM enzyme